MYGEVSFLIIFSTSELWKCFECVGGIEALSLDEAVSMNIPKLAAC